MLETIQSVFDKLANQYGDFREHLFEVKIESYEDRVLVLSGRVLEETYLRVIRQAVNTYDPGVLVNVKAVKVLRQPENRLMSVGTNLSSLHRGTSFLAEQLSQLLYGTQVEILEEQDRWAFVRCVADGYLGWTYIPYLTQAEIPAPTHLVSAVTALVLAEPADGAAVLTRSFIGTGVRVLETQGEWARVAASQTGWVKLTDLRALAAMPHTAAEKRQQMIADVKRLVGIPYLWGGTAADGIDCSGTAQLIHRLSGITIRRDADMQMDDGKPVREPDYQPGDLVFFGEKGDKRSVTHVGISLGGWKVMHSSRARNGVYEDDIQAVDHLRESFLGGCTYIK